MKKVAFYTLGCKLNYSETSTISRLFEEKGYRKVDFTDSPDIFIINTCSVTENADKKCHKIVREARGISPDGYVAIIGCYAQLKPKEIAEIPGVDAVLGAAEKFRLVELLDGFVRKPQPEVFASDIENANRFNTSYSINDRTRTFLKVQDGCDYSCTFCTIPLARGNSRSDSIENILKTANEIATTEVKEIVLTGVNTGDFGIQDGKRIERFIDLAKALDEVDGIERFRISSIEPNLLTDEVISFVSQSKRFVPHFHVPLQSGSDKILKLMKRRYLRELYADRVNSIKTKMPHCCIGVDVIVGFPGESEEDFGETLTAVEKVGFDDAYTFKFSLRDGTPATRFPASDTVSDEVASDRLARLIATVRGGSRERNLKLLGERREALVEKSARRGGLLQSRTRDFKTVMIPGDVSLIGQYLNVELTGTTGSTFIGQVVGQRAALPMAG